MFKKKVLANFSITPNPQHTHPESPKTGFPSESPKTHSHPESPKTGFQKSDPQFIFKEHAGKSSAQKTVRTFSKK